MAHLVDTHAHLDYPELMDNIDDVLIQAEEAGVSKIIIPGVNLNSIPEIIKLIEKYDNLYGAVSCHPQDVHTWDDESYNKLNEVLKHPKMVAVGETGLDYYWTKDNKPLQKEVFKAHIRLAKENNLPLIIHNRDAHADTYELIKYCKSFGVNGVMHCFSGSADFALECVKNNFYISLAGPLTFKNAKKIKEVAQVVPLSYLLVETDSPYLTPHPFRGKKPNQPSYVKYVAMELSQLKDISYEEIAKITTSNAFTLFKL